MQTLLHLFNSPLGHPGSGVISLLCFIGIIALGTMAWQMHILDDLIDALPKKSRFKERGVLTENEAEFFSRLQRALPDLGVYPQMAMSALIQPAVPESDPNYWNYRRQFDRKVCDFVIARKGCFPAESVIVVIELDDKTHNKEKDAWRDKMLRSAGIKTIRYESREKPSEKQIHEDVYAVLTAQSSSHQNSFA